MKTFLKRVAKTVVSVVIEILNNHFWITMAAIALLSGHYGVAITTLIVAFYVKLDDISSGIKAANQGVTDVSVTVDRQPALKAEEGRF